MTRGVKDFDTKEALQLLTLTDLEKLGLSIGQKRVLEAAMKKLREDVKEKPSPFDATGTSYPVTSKSLASDAGMEEFLKTIERVGSLEESLLALGSTDVSSAKPPALNTWTLPRLDNDPHVFLGLQQKGTSAKQDEKPLLIPDFVNLGTYDNREEEQEIGNNSSGAKIVIRSARGKPKLEHVTLSMWVAANSRIMHELLRTGKLSATTTAIADYLAYTIKFAELLESHTLASALAYDNEYRKLQCEYGFRWGSESQHLHTRFLVKRRPSQTPAATSPNAQRFPPHLKHQPQTSPTTPIYRQFNSLRDAFDQTADFNMSAWCQIATKVTNSTNIQQRPQCDF